MLFRSGAIRHAHAALAHGRDDAIALSWGGFNIGMVEHDRGAAREAFEAALALSPSSGITYLLGGMVLGLAGEAERAIEWGKRGQRLSPLDPFGHTGWHGMFLGYFQQGGYEDATSAARKAIQVNPGFSISYMFLAGALARAGHIDEAKTAASRVLALQPNFSIGEWCAAVDPVPAIAEPLAEALSAAGLPE